jgi:acetyltransferase-like isoleucine patch superfamily enzyme
MKTGRFHFAQFAMRLIPLTRGFAFKRVLLRWCGIQIEDRVSCTSTVRFFTGGAVRIGAASWIGPETLFIGGTAPIEIGRNCDIAPQVSFVTGTHQVLRGEQKAAGAGESRSVVVGDGCWIGTRATILGGTNIGQSSIVAAGAVVRGNFPPRSLIAGVPAKVVRTLDEGS